MLNRLRCAAVMAATIAALACGSDGPTAPTAHEPAAAALAVGSRYACALNTSGQAFCWGDNANGTLGDGTTNDDSIPVAVKGGPYAALSASDNTICALSAAGVVSCWGSLPGTGSVSHAQTSSTPVIEGQSPTSKPFVSISAGLDYVCALDGAGAAYCWGENNIGQLGVGDTTRRAAPTLVAGGLTFASISASVVHTCGLTTGGSFYCWGENFAQQLGSAAAAGQVITAPALATTTTFTSVGIGGIVSCGIAAGGTVSCFGSDEASELGTGGNGPNSSTPVTPAGTLKFASIAPGRVNDIFNTVCGITTDGSPVCWGDNAGGQAGPTGTTCTAPGLGTQESCVVIPTTVAGVGATAAIAVGVDHTCALTVSRQIMCWGTNAHGQLGDGTTKSRSTPAPIAGSIALP